jgi:hypothetical protein
MADLESALNEVKDLKDQLSRMIVVQEGKGHHELVFTHGFGWAAAYPPTNLVREPVYFIDIPRITRPDTETQSAAREKLLNLYYHSPHLLVRYIAARAVDKPVSEILYKEFWGLLWKIS